MGSTPLRGSHKLWKPLIGTPEGIAYLQFDFRALAVAADGTVTIRCDALGFPAGIREEQDEYLGDIVNLALPDVPVRDCFEWILAPSRMTVGKRDFLGFSVRYRFTSRKGRRIYRLFDDATWEIGGRATGNTLLLQGEVNPPATELTRELFFTTACNYYGAEMTGFMTEPTRVSFQRLPRFGTLQAFDFLAHRKGALIGLFDPLEDVLSVIQKNRDEDCLHILDEHRRPLSDSFESHPRHILFHKPSGDWTREDQRNLWAAVYDRIHSAARRRARVKPSPILPRIWIPQITGNAFRLDGAAYPREKGLYALADRRMETWAAMGVREICTHSLWHSDYTEDRLRFKDQTGMHGGLTVGSICNVRVHEIAPLWGGPEAVRYFVRKAHALGIQVQLWWASHLSRRAPIFEERPDFMLIARDGLPNGGGFGHQSLVTLDLNNRDCFAWLLEKLVTLHRQTGFDGLFHDSYGNMTFLPMHYADPRRRGQQRAYERFVSRLQKAGIRTFAVEGIGPLGVGHFGMNLLPEGRSPGSYQCALNWWLGQEDMLYGLNMGIDARPWKDDTAPTPFEFAFRSLASGGRFGFTGHDADHTEVWAGWLRDLNRLHGRFAPLRGQRTLLPAANGVLWQRERDRLLFAYRSFKQAVPPRGSVLRIEPDGETPVPTSENQFTTQPWAVYRLR